MLAFALLSDVMDGLMLSPPTGHQQNCFFNTTGVQHVFTADFLPAGHVTHVAQVSSEDEHLEGEPLSPDTINSPEQ